MYQFFPCCKIHPLIFPSGTHLAWTLHSPQGHCSPGLVHDVWLEHGLKAAIKWFWQGFGKMKTSAYCDGLGTSQYRFKKVINCGKGNLSLELRMWGSIGSVSTLGSDLITGRFVISLGLRGTKFQSSALIWYMKPKKSCFTWLISNNQGVISNLSRLLGFDCLVAWRDHLSSELHVWNIMIHLDIFVKSPFQL